MSAFSRVTGWISSLFSSENKKNAIKSNHSNSGNSEGDSVESDTSGTRRTSSESSGSFGSSGGIDFPYPTYPPPPFYGMDDFARYHGPGRF